MGVESSIFNIKSEGTHITAYVLLHKFRKSDDNLIHKRNKNFKQDVIFMFLYDKIGRFGILELRNRVAKPSCAK